MNKEYLFSSSSLYMKEIMQTIPLTKKEEQELFKLVRKGSLKAREKLLVSNLRFVLKVAREYRGYTITLADLVSEGVIGLARAIESFDYTRGLKFISYAVWWIKVYISRSVLLYTSFIRLPAHKQELVKKGIKDRAAGRELDAEIQALIKLGERGYSFDTPVRQGSQSTFSDFLPDEYHASPEAEAQMSSSRCFARHMLTELPEKEALVLRRLFGIDYSGPETLKSISESMGLSKERVRQIRDRALQRLKKGKLKRALKEQLESCLEANN
jgi:RNA polymerase primary sigma factor